MTNTAKHAPGAGRPRLGVGRTERKTITIAPEDVALLLTRYGTDNLSDAVRAAVRELRGQTEVIADDLIGAELRHLRERVDYLEQERRRFQDEAKLLQHELARERKRANKAEAAVRKLRGQEEAG